MRSLKWVLSNGSLDFFHFFFHCKSTQSSQSINMKPIRYVQAYEYDCHTVESKLKATYFCFCIYLIVRTLEEENLMNFFCWGNVFILYWIHSGNKDTQGIRGLYSEDKPRLPYLSLCMTWMLMLTELNLRVWNQEIVRVYCFFIVFCSSRCTVYFCFTLKLYE